MAKSKNTANGEGEGASETAESRGPRALKNFSDDSTIHVKAESCPRREGSKGAANWALYQEGMTVRQFRDAGGDPSKLATDVGKGHVEIQPAPETAAA